MNENRLIPYQTSSLLSGPWLVFAPHPDDETFGMGGSLLLAKQAGIEVDVVIMTDGGQGFANDAEDIVAIREAEALDACHQMGVRDCYFWRQKDRALASSGELDRRIQELVKAREPAHVFIPSCLEFHPDHRATATIVWNSVQAALSSTAVIVSYDITNLGPCNLLIDISSVAIEKERVMALYASQVESHRYIELVQSINKARTFSLGDECHAAEGFCVLPRLPGMSYDNAMQAWFGRFLSSEPVHKVLVSVVIRTKDRPQLLSQALASLALQTHDKLEVVVVNDGGESVSAALSAYESAFSVLKQINNATSKGRAAAANQGMQEVSGKYFIFLDDDDWFDPTHIAKLVQAHVKNNGLIAAYTGVRAVDSELNSVQVFDESFDRNRLFYENFIPIHAVLIKRSVIEAGYRMDESLEVFEDWDFWLQLCQITEVFEHVEGVTANYRIDSNSGIGVKGGHDDVRRRLYARWSRVWGINEIDDLLTRLVVLTKRST